MNSGKGEFGSRVLFQLEEGRKRRAGRREGFRSLIYTAVENTCIFSFLRHHVSMHMVSVAQAELSELKEPTRPRTYTVPGERHCPVSFCHKNSAETWGIWGAVPICWSEGL